MIPCGYEQNAMRQTAVGSRAVPEQSANTGAHLDMRGQLWSAFLAALNDSKLPYCVLGAPENPAHITDSDVDFAVRPSDYKNVPRLLASAAAAVGGQLIQAIEHETTATYFAIAVQQHGGVAFLHPDCSSDYRREGRLWMRAEDLLRERRRTSTGYFRPAPDVDFKYYLTKQVLKQSLSTRQWRKLITLYQAASHPREALSWWRVATAAQIEQSLLHNDQEACKTLLPHLRSELLKTPFRESPTARTSSFLLESARMAVRILRPTGLFVQVRDGSPRERKYLAWKLARTLAPAFRRAVIVNHSTPARVLRVLIESTLVVSTDEMLPFRTLYGGVSIHWQAKLMRSENLESAIDAVLSHLSKRTMRRRAIQPSRPQRIELETMARPTVS